MQAVCLLVAGIARATLPEPAFTLAWVHSVEKVRWVEHYRVDGDHLLLAKAWVEGSGAGMEPPAEAVPDHGGWSWEPRRALPELRITLSTFARDYRLCWHDACRDLGALVGPQPEGTVVVVRPCPPAR